MTFSRILQDEKAAEQDFMGKTSLSGFPYGEMKVNPFKDGLDIASKKETPRPPPAASQDQTQAESKEGLKFLPLFAPPGIRFSLKADFTDDLAMRVALTTILYQSYSDEVLNHCTSIFKWAAVFEKTYVLLSILAKQISIQLPLKLHQP